LYHSSYSIFRQIEHCNRFSHETDNPNKKIPEGLQTGTPAKEIELK
jgi:hypothetical protein